MHVHGYKEEGTTTTPFDMVVLNQLDRFHLIEAVIKWVPKLADHAAPAKRYLQEKLRAHTEYIQQYGEDMPEIRNWTWS